MAAATYPPLALHSAAAGPAANSRLFGRDFWILAAVFLICQLAPALGLGLGVGVVLTLLGCGLAIYDPFRWAPLCWESMLAGSLLFPLTQIDFAIGNSGVMGYWAAMQATCYAALVIGCAIHESGSRRRLHIPTALLAILFAASAGIGYVSGASLAAVGGQFYGTLVLVVGVYLFCRVLRGPEAAPAVLVRAVNGIAAFALCYLVFSARTNVTFSHVSGMAFYRVLTPAGTLWTWAAVVSVCGALAGESPLRRWLVWLLFIATLAFSGGRGALLIAVATPFVVWLMLPGLQFRKRLPALLIVAAAVAILNYGPQLEARAGLLGNMARRLDPNSDTSLADRLELWQLAAAIGHNAPFGRGLGSTFSIVDKVGENTLTSSYVDNGYAFVLIKFGYLGAIVIAGWLALLMARFAPRFRANRGSPTYHAAAAGMIAMLGEMLGFPAFFQFEGSCIAGFVVALFVVLGTG